MLASCDIGTECGTEHGSLAAGLDPYFHISRSHSALVLTVGDSGF